MPDINTLFYMKPIHPTNLSISPQTQHDLESSRQRIPRYLFRASSDASGGGEAGLNDAAGVVPHAFLGDSNGHDTIYTIPSLSSMTKSHLKGDKSIRSEFSSWGASILMVLALCHGMTKEKQGDVCFAVLDVKLLPDPIAVYHALALYYAGLSLYPYDHEYLVHGEIEGSFYTCVKFLDLVNSGLYDFFPELRKSDFWGLELRHEQWKTTYPLTDDDLGLATKLIDVFGRHSCLDLKGPLLLALLTIRPRVWVNNATEPGTSDFDRIVVKLVQLNFSSASARQLRLDTTGVYTGSYFEIRQMLELNDLIVERLLVAESMENTGA
ncbi:hypothetical protein EJ08DRAFT_76677 [Tothia fuscella]|uniref:DUF7587 domain-containing protein n=1 Tax=Tothia fuscella TaxID=1048955 RepID=A0A9P4NY22_9PEZI|nr:hypothetical protein EJ08DRAFT_76677 [Tothia fuscella]